MTEIMKTLMPAFVPSCFNFWSSDPIFHLSQSCLSSWTLVQSVGKTNCYRGSHSAFWWDEQNPHHQHSLIGWKYSRPKNNWGGEFESPWWFHFSDLCSFQQVIFSLKKCQILSSGDLKLIVKDHNEHREQLNRQHNITSCFYRRPLLGGEQDQHHCCVSFFTPSSKVYFRKSKWKMNWIKKEILLLKGGDWRPDCSWDWLGELLEESLCLWLW